MSTSVDAIIIRIAGEWALYTAGKRPADSDPDVNLRRLEKYFRESYQFLQNYLPDAVTSK